MKTADRRNRILLLYVILLLASFAYGRFARAADSPAPNGAPQAGKRGSDPQLSPDPSQVPSSRDPRAGGHQIPNERELRPEEYAWLGAVVWSQLQQSADPQRRDLNEEEIRALIDRMERNRQEVTLTLPELYQLMRSPSLCSNSDAFPKPTACPEPQRAGAFGYDIPRKWKQLR